MDERTKQNFDLLIKNWFYNAIENKPNDSILVLIDSGNFTVNSFSFKLNQLVHHENSINYSRINNTRNNHILILNPIQPIRIDISKIQTKLLIIEPKHNFYANVKSYINADNYTEINIPQNEQHNYWLQKDNLIDLIQNPDSTYLQALLQVKIWTLQHIYTDNLKLIMKDTSFNEYPSNNLFEDVEMLSGYKVLTSRLAVIMYRLCLLDIHATTTKIGRSIYALTGTKSKTFTVKMLLNITKNNQLYISKDLLHKHFKAYNLNVNDKEVAIRIEIANNLLSFNVDELTLEMIAKSTNLPLQTIEKLSHNLL